jgi:hypothetical protein
LSYLGINLIIGTQKSKSGSGSILILWAHKCLCIHLKLFYIITRIYQSVYHALLVKSFTSITWYTLQVI